VPFCGKSKSRSATVHRGCSTSSSSCRAFAFVSWGAAPVFGLLLFFYLFGLSLGSLQSKRLCRDRSAEGQGRRLRDLAILIAVADLVGFLVIPALGRFATHDWRFSFLLVSLSAGTMGCVLPVVSHYGIEPDDRAGMNLSYVYLANIIGSACGSYLTGFVLMDLWSTRAISGFLALAGLGVVIPLLIASGGGAHDGAFVGILGPDRLSPSGGGAPHHRRKSTPGTCSSSRSTRRSRAC
jgi:hypothetical protein